MTYGEELDILTRRLAALLATPSEPYDESAVQAALSGRKSLLGLMTAQLREVVPMDRSAGRTDFQGIVAHPVAALSACLRSYPRPDGEVAPSDLRAAGQATTVGRLWVQLGHAATQAQAAWQGVGERLDADQSWAVVADVAAMAGALAHIDGHLGNASATLAHDDLRSPVTTGQCLRLSVTASEVLSLASAGPVVGDPPQRRQREALGIVLASEPEGFVRGQLRLAELLVASGPVKPEHVQQIAIALARSSLLIARTANAHHMDDLGLLLNDQAQALGQVPKQGRRVAMAVPGDPRPVAQAGEIARTLGIGLLAPGVSPHEAAAAVAAAVVRLHSQARRDLARGLWLVPDERPRAPYIWRPWVGGLQVPSLIENLKVAVTAAESIEPMSAQDRRVALRRPHHYPSLVDGLVAPAPRDRRPVTPAVSQKR